MKSVYGPVNSWRLGNSLGIDLICQEKICNFNCIYCQQGKTKGERKISKRKKFIELSKLKKELKEILPIKADVITFSGSGEPTLALNMGQAIKTVRKNIDSYFSSNLPLALITNSSLLSQMRVRKELRDLDLVVAKLDAVNQKMLKTINRPTKDLYFEKILRGLKEFRKEFAGKLAIQIMFLEENKDYVEEFAYLCEELNPEEIQINTPLRPCAVNPISKEELEKIQRKFEKVYNSEYLSKEGRKAKIISVYQSKKFQKNDDGELADENKMEIIKRRYGS